MNMFYTGLGIARSLGQRRIPVVGLTAQSGIYGNYTRYARILSSPDSRHEPEALLAFLLRLKDEIGSGSVLFPTRDDDVVFLDRFREQLEPHFRLVAPSGEAIALCLNKWQTYLYARQAEVATPQCWLIESQEDLALALQQVRYPCVLKPLAAHYWRQGRNWDIVGARKAIELHSPEQLIAEYATIGLADKRALLQEMVPGSDESLVITACYIDRKGRWAGAFNAQKLIQEPAGFGTGCIVQSISLPELFEPTMRLLREMRFTGIAEVEYKRDAGDGAYKLIEVNPRPWDQHILGRACGVDLIHLAYCDHAGLPMPEVHPDGAAHKWVADDTFVIAAVRALPHRDGRFRSLFKHARGRRVYAIWSAKDPLPFLIFFVFRLIPQLARASFMGLWWRLAAAWRRPVLSAKGGSVA